MQDNKSKDILYTYQDLDINSCFPLQNTNPENIPITLAADDNYTIYTGVCIESILSNANKNFKYDIYILGEGMQPENIQKLNQVVSKYENASLKIVNVTPLLENCKEFFVSSLQYNITVYYRFFIQDIFKNFKKVIYLDSDLIVTGDISELYNTNIDNYYLGAIRDLFMKIWRPNDEQEDYYLKNILKLEDGNDYFQSGVLLINNEQFVKNNIFEKLIEKLKEVKFPVLPDQDILNAVCQGNVLYIGNEWNYDWNIENFDRNDPSKSAISRHLTTDEYNAYLYSKNHPKIIHYAGLDKPWKNPSLPMADIFWYYARKLPFYEEIIYKSIEKPPISTFEEETVESNIENNIPPFYKNKWQKLFSVKNQENHKVFTIAGVKIKIKRKSIAN